MKHDKEIIDGAKERGVFDSSFDAQSLSLGDEEKRNLAARIKQSESTVSSSSVKQERSFDIKKKSKYVFRPLTIIEKILFFLKKTFSGMTEKEFYQQLAMKDIKSSLRSIRPSVYSFSNNRVTGYVGEQVYGLEKAMAVFSKNLEICRQRKFSSETENYSFTWFFVQEFVGDMTNLHEKIDYAYIEKNRESFTDERIKETVNYEVNEVLRQIPDEKRVLLNKLYSNLIGFERLGEFNYYGMLRKFDTNFAGIQGGLPSFHSVDEDLVVLILMQLEDLLYSIDIGLDMSQINEILVAYFKKVQFEGEGSWSMDDFTRLNKAVRRFLNNSWVVKLVAMLKKDPFHTPKIRERKINIVELFRTELFDAILSRSKALMHQLKLAEMGNLVKEIFGNEPLLKIENYNEHANEKLSSHGLPLFVFTKHVELLKTYYERIFVDFVRPTLSIVIVDGEFYDRLLQNMLTDFYYKFEEAFVLMREFELLVSSKAETGQKIRSFLLSGDDNVESARILKEKIYFVNGVCQKAIRAIAERMKQGSISLEAIIKDIHAEKNKKEFLMNIDTVGGVKNSKIKLALEKIHKATTLVHDVISGV